MCWRLVPLPCHDTARGTGLAIGHLRAGRRDGSARDGRRVDRAQRGRIRRLGGGCDPAGLAQQPDSEPGAAGAAVAVGPGEHGSGLAGGVGGEGEPGLANQGGDDRGELPDQ